MKKQRNILIGLLTGFSAILVAVIILFAFKVIKLWAFLTFGLISLFAIGLSILLLVKVIKKIKKMALEMKKKNAMETTGNYMLDIYTLLGIPPQYNKDGTLKNVYELLGIEPMFDEFGNRILTPYELLGILPKFDANGREIPAFYVIKNRIGRIAKVGISTEFLTRKLSKEEEEQKIIRETLEKQLKEAEAKKDDKKAALIKKVIKDNKKKTDKKKSAKKKGSDTVKFATGSYKPVYFAIKKDKKGKDNKGGKKEEGKTEKTKVEKVVPTETVEKKKEPEVIKEQPVSKVIAGNDQEEQANNSGVRKFFGENAGGKPLSKNNFSNLHKDEQEIENEL